MTGTDYLYHVVKNDLSIVCKYDMQEVILAQTIVTMTGLESQCNVGIPVLALEGLRQHTILAFKQIAAFSLEHPSYTGCFFSEITEQGVVKYMIDVSHYLCRLTTIENGHDAKQIISEHVFLPILCLADIVDYMQQAIDYSKADPTGGFVIRLDLTGIPKQLWRLRSITQEEYKANMN